MKTPLKIFLRPLLALVLLLGMALPVLAAQQGAADYHSSLTSGISATANTLTVVSTSTPSGESLIAGQVYGLKLGGREYTLGLLGGNKTFSGLTRGVSLINGTTTGGVAEAWGRGTSVEITDAPVLLEILNKIAGRQVFDNVIKYDSAIATTTVANSRDNIVNVGLLNDTAFNGAGVVNASTVIKGVSEIATAAEVAASTAIGGTGAPVVVPASVATTTYNAATSVNVIPVTGVSGKIDNNFIATSTLFTNANISGASLSTSTAIGSFPAWQIGKQSIISTTTGTSTFAVPSGITKVWVETLGGGAPGGGASASGHSGSGGGGGCWASRVFDLTGTSTVQYYVAGTTEATKFGTNGFYMTAFGGSGGSDSTSGVQGGAGGQCVGGDINVPGQQGDASYSASTPGSGGSSQYGHGGSPSLAGASAGNPGTGFGSGGSGAISSGSNNGGGAGTSGMIIFRW